MVKVCCVTDCNKEYRAAVRFSFINIPKCPKRIKEWEAITALNLSENSVICKDHFKEEDFVPESPNLLTPNAVPSLFPKASRVEGISTPELTSATCLKTEVKDEPEDTYENDNEQAQNYTEITIEKHDPDELLAAARNRENEAVGCKREYNNGGSDGSRKKCVNCGIATRGMRKRCTSSVPSVQLALLARWLTIEVPKEAIICHQCFELLTSGTAGGTRLLGHKTVCIDCGRSVRQVRRNVVAKNSPMRQGLPRTHPAFHQVMNYACYNCWTRYQRKAIRDQKQLKSAPRIKSELSHIPEHKDFPSRL